MPDLTIILIQWLSKLLILFFKNEYSIQSSFLLYSHVHVYCLIKMYVYMTVLLHYCLQRNISMCGLGNANAN